jgi:hypothetical protein
VKLNRDNFSKRTYLNHKKIGIRRKNSFKNQQSHGDPERRASTVFHWVHDQAWVVLKTIPFTSILLALCRANAKIEKPVLRRETGTKWIYFLIVDTGNEKKLGQN